LLITLALLAGINQAAAQGARFLRISGPAATTITALRADGTMVWSNAQPGATYTIQTVSSLPGGTNWVDYVQIPVTNGVNTNLLIAFNPPDGMALIPAGSFTMGNCMNSNESYSDELPLHSVYVSAFYMDKYDVTKALWDSVYQWATNYGYSFDYAGLGKAANHPVQTIDWWDAVKWCNARSEQEGRTPAYYTSAAQTTVYRSGQVNLTNACVNWVANGYRLPTEAEWEKAARGGVSGQRFAWGDIISQSLANYYGNTGYAYDLGPNGSNTNYTSGGYPYTSPVGSFAPNGYGLYDMAGNVWQWCWDWYDGSWYSNAGATQTDPRGPGGALSYRVLRGGSWNVVANVARCANRSSGNPNDDVNLIGFRCVRGL
jgi:formylglycine-generating enzyme required for sulfatase activity